MPRWQQEHAEEHTRGSPCERPVWVNPGACAWTSTLLLYAPLLLTHEPTVRALSLQACLEHRAHAHISHETSLTTSRFSRLRWSSAGTFSASQRSTVSRQLVQIKRQLTAAVCEPARPRAPTGWSGAAPCGSVTGPSRVRRSSRSTFDHGTLSVHSARADGGSASPAPLEFIGKACLWQVTGAIDQRPNHGQPTVEQTGQTTISD